MVTIENSIELLFIRQLERETTLYTVVQEILQMEEMSGAALYACGGMIRDAAISQMTGVSILSADFDFVCEGLGSARCREVLKNLKDNCAAVKEVIHVGKSFPVWKIKVEGMSDLVDFALTRTESSFGNHHRDFHVSAEAASIEDDSLRRDFTINAMYIRLFLNDSGYINGELIDFHGGLLDVEKKKINCVGRPEDRFREDPLRMLRAVRFAARFAGFGLSDQTAGSIEHLAADLVQTISRERICNELYKMVVVNPEKALVDIERVHILSEIIPQLVPLDAEKLQEICSRISRLQRMQDGQVAPDMIFAALFFDLAKEELAERMVESMSCDRLPANFFSITIVKDVARALKIPGIKNLVSLCDDTLLLINYDHLQYRDAVLEEVCQRYSRLNQLFDFYRAQEKTFDRESEKVLERVANLPESAIDFKKLLLTSGIPIGPHLSDLKRQLRQAEIDGRICSEEDAGQLLHKLYLEDTHLLQEHAKKIRNFIASGGVGNLPAEVWAEVRWLLLSKPARLIRVYQANNLLGVVFPELLAAEEGVQLSSEHHFVDSFLNDALLGMSLLYEEESHPTAVQILALLFLDIGKVRTHGIGAKGQAVYYGHENAGAEMAYQICNRLGIDQCLSSDVFFIIKNHNALVTAGGPNRFRNLIGTVDNGLLDDLLLVHRVDQLAKMEIRDGRRIDAGQLRHFYQIIQCREEWTRQVQERAEKFRLRHMTPFLNGMDLQQDNSFWGSGLSKGAALGEIKRNLVQLQLHGIIGNRDEALFVARNHIVLHHLSTNPVWYLETLRERKLLENVLPEIAALIGLEQKSKYHQEDAYVHTLNVLRNLPKNCSKSLKLAAVFHDIGKSVAQSFDETEGVYHFYGHEKESVEMLLEICRRFSWTDSCFNVVKVNWLIANHIRINQNWGAMKDPRKAINKMFFRHSRPDLEIPFSFRQDLLELRLADTSGSVVSDRKVREGQVKNYRLLVELMADVGQQRAKQKVLDQREKKVKQHWNGHLVMQYFSVTGPDIGRLVAVGQNYVRDCLHHGQPVSVRQVVEIVKEICKK
jgi:tRNA nucleotidyltransferase/poly(A) polymerase